MENLSIETLNSAIEVMENSYRFRADNDNGYMLNDGDVIQSISFRCKVSFEISEAMFNVLYPNIKLNRGRYISREEEILINIGVNAVKCALKGTTPTREELREYAVIQADKTNLPDVEMFIRHCECNITMRFEMGTPLSQLVKEIA